MCSAQTLLSTCGGAQIVDEEEEDEEENRMDQTPLSHLKSRRWECFRTRRTKLSCIADGDEREHINNINYDNNNNNIIS